MSGDVETYTYWVKADLADRFYLPIFYPLAKFFVLLFGDYSFVLMPLMFFGIGLFFLFKLFRLFNLEPLFVLFAFVLSYKSFSFVWFFTRDNVLFALACVFAFFFFKILYFKGNGFRWLFLIAFLAVFVKSFGVSLLIFALALFFYKHKLFAFFVFIPWYSRYFSDWFKPFGVLKSLDLFLLPLVFLNLFNFLFVFVFFFSFVFKSFFQFFFSFFFLGSFFVVLNLGYLPSEAFRYVFVLFPFLLFYFALCFGRLWDSLSSRFPFFKN